MLANKSAIPISDSRFGKKSAIHLKISEGWGRLPLVALSGPPAMPAMWSLSGPPPFRLPRRVCSYGRDGPASPNQALLPHRRKWGDATLSQGVKDAVCFTDQQLEARDGHCRACI